MRFEGERLELLAGEYVVGTLAGPARRRFERLLPASPPARDAVALWEQRLAGLDRRLRPVTPDPRTWRAIAGRLALAAGGGRSPGRGTVRRFLLPLAAALVLAVAGLTWLYQTRIPAPYLTARFDTAQGQQLWGFEAPQDYSRLRVRALGPVRPPANRSYEIWALPEEGREGAVVSLGLVPADAQGELRLTLAQQAALATAGRLAITDEPLGGSPTGVATGPILYVTPVMRRG
jgi:anti-sigma-K factor RskA